MDQFTGMRSGIHASLGLEKLPDLIPALVSKDVLTEVQDRIVMALLIILQKQTSDLTWERAKQCLVDPVVLVEQLGLYHPDSSIYKPFVPTAQPDPTPTTTSAVDSTATSAVDSTTVDSTATSAVDSTTTSAVDSTTTSAVDSTTMDEKEAVSSAVSEAVSSAVSEAVSSAVSEVVSSAVSEAVSSAVSEPASESSHTDSQEAEEAEQLDKLGSLVKSITAADVETFSVESPALSLLYEWLKFAFGWSNSVHKTRSTRVQLEKAQSETSELLVKLEAARQVMSTCSQALETTYRPVLEAQKWFIVSSVVKPSEGYLGVYLNGHLTAEYHDLDPADLKLHTKIVCFGGGKKALNRGGDVRRILINGSAMDPQQILSLYEAMANESPAMGGRVCRIQAVVRGFLARLHCDQEKVLEREKKRSFFEACTSTIP